MRMHKPGHAHNKCHYDHLHTLTYVAHVMFLLNSPSNCLAHTQAAHLSNIRDLPPISGAIIWSRQIKRQLAAYMQRVEDVLGKSWEHDPDGKLLREEGERFEKKLNTDVIFEKVRVRACAYMHACMRSCVLVRGMRLLVSLRVRMC